MMIDIKNKKKVIMPMLMVLLTFFVLLNAAYSQTDIINVKNNAVISFKNNSIIKVNGSIVIDNGSTFQQNGTVTLNGNWTNNGNQTSSSGVVTFIGANTSKILGSTATSTQFNSINVNKTNAIDTVWVDCNIFSATDGFLVLSKGIFKFGGLFSFSNTFFFPYSAGNFIIPFGTGFIFDNPNAIVLGQSSDGMFFLRGMLTINQGIFNVGTTGQSSLIYDNPLNASILRMGGGELNIYSRLAPGNPAIDSINFTQSNGTVKVGIGTKSNETNVGNFHITSGSTFNASGGNIEINRQADNSVADVVISAGNYSVTGGTLKVNSQIASQLIEVNSSVPLWNVALLGNNDAQLKLLSNLVIKNDIELNGIGSNRFNMNNFNLNLAGNWTNNLVSTDGFNPGTQRVLFNGLSTQNIQGTASTPFNNFDIDKIGGKIELMIATRINGNAKFLSDSAIVDMNSYDLTLGQNTVLYADNGVDYDLLSFTDSKCIQNTGSTSPLIGAKLIKEIAQNPTLPITLRYPLGTEGVYTPAKIEVHTGGATIGANAYVAIKVVPLEHPSVETPDVSLTKYWVVSKNNITLNSQGATCYFYYDNSEVQGTEGSYRVLYFAPSYNNPAGYWRIDPGVADDIVDFNQKFFYSQFVDEIAGDWVAGEAEAASAIYYARQDGDYNTPSTWSKFGFNGVASSTAPNKYSDRVRIQDHTVTVSSPVATSNSISIENGTSGRLPGKIRFEGNNYLHGDTVVIEDNTTVFVENIDGFSLTPTATGAIQSTVRTLSPNVIYEFTGGNTQITGSAFPDIVRCIRVNKASGSVVSISKNIAIADSLIINDGVMDLASFTMNGNSSNRSLVMRGGELRIPGTFPTNYLTPTFIAGTINFQGVGNNLIPSTGTTPAVNQYFNLKIAGVARAGNITFSNLGETKISNQLDISQLNFSSNTYKFFTNGSTIIFNKNGGSQDIPIKPQSPSDTTCFIEYYNLVLDSSGTKQISSTGSPLFKVLNNISIRNNVAFNSNGFNIEVLNDWYNISGTFNPGTNTVIFRSPVATFYNDINSRSTIDNPFYNVRFAGAGLVKSIGNLLVNGNLTIDNGSAFEMTVDNVTIKGNWINNGGSYVPGTSTVFFNGLTTQTISKTSGNVNFYNLQIDNSQNVNSSAVGATSDNGINISNNLILQSGNLRSHIGTNYRYVSVTGALTRPGNGFVDGELRKNISIGATSKDYEVGYLNSYTPINLTFTGTGGTAGFLGVMSDTVTTTTTPINWADPSPSSINPANNNINAARHVARQYKIKAPTGSLFALGGSREYSTIIKFIKGNAPNGDQRNGAATSNYVAKIYNGSSWIGPFNYGTKPLVGVRTDSTIQFTNIVDFGHYLVGEPGMITYYTRNSGDWNDANNWSTQGYNGIVATSYPNELGNNYKAYIGFGHNINLNSNKTITNLSGDSAFVQIDSSGKLFTNNFTISGDGAFRLKKYSTLGIGNVDGIATSGATGNIQTGTRNYNSGTHNLGTFVYTSTGAQNSGNGIPSGLDSLQKIIIDKPSGTITLNGTGAVYVKDSLFIKSGGFNLGSQNIYILKNIIKANSATLTTNSKTVYLRGDNPIYVVADNYAQPFIFDNFDVYKDYNTGNVVLGSNTNIEIVSNLNFVTGNKSLIDATTNTTQANPLFVKIGNSATVTGAGHIDFTNSGGWVYGEVIKNVPAGNAPAVIFETGTALFYSPFSIDFNGTGGTAGYLSGSSISGSHPKLYRDPASLYPINPSRNVTVYWRLKKPNGSSFDRAARAADYRVYLINPEQQTNTDCFNCADLAFYRGGDSLQWWQSMALNNGGENSNNGNGTCSDTRIAPHPAPSFAYSGNNCSVTPLVFIQVNNVPSTLPFGSTDFFSNGDLLLADFVAGNRNSIKYYKFYSIKDGDWSDPTTWSTTGYNGTINQAALDNDPTIRPIPSRQYDNVFIGNGKKVKLDVNIGTNLLSADPNANGLAGPSVFVETTGTLDFGTSVLRGNQFNAKAGSTIIIGSNDGITTTNLGNVQGASYASGPKYNDSINVVYATSGRTSNGQQRPLINRNSLTHYIESVTIKKASDNSVVMQYTSGDKYLLTTFGNLRAMASCSLNVGEQYYIEINPSNTGTNRKYKVFAEWDYDQDMADANEQLSNDNSTDDNLVTTTTFTVPITDKGSSQLRIGMSGNASDFAWNSGNTNINTSGEFEDFTIHINNPNYAASQVNGAGLPNLLQSLTIHSPNQASANPQFTLSKNLTVIDDIKIKSGTFNSGNSEINLFRDFINDTLNGLNMGATGFVNFGGGLTQNIGGTNPIKFSNLNIDKTTNKVNINNNITINNNLTFKSDNNLVLNPNNTLTFTNTANIVTLSGNYSNNRMIEVDGISDSSKITKQFYNTNYCSPSLRWGNTADQYITNVTYGTLNNASGKSGYSDFTYLTPPTITAGTPTNITITKNDIGNRRWDIWFDFNKNGTFDNATERLVSSVNSSTINQNITIPITALNGLTLMRIRMRSSANSDACENTNTEGEFEDYIVNITDGTNTSNQNYVFLFPIGTSNIYNPANFVLKATNTGSPSISVLLKSGKHPNRLSEDVLGKYWKVASTGFENVVADSLKFGFDNSDINGNVASYIPSRYFASNWEINLGNLPKVANNFITIKPTVADSLYKIDGDWSTGVPVSFFAGRIFFSRNVGVWNDRTSWSNVGHNGPVSQYYPGDIYFQDTVNIDGHTITFNADSIVIDSLRIGGTNASPIAGILTFANAPVVKQLEARTIFMDNDNGQITGTTGGNRKDTIHLHDNLINNTTGTLTLHSGVNDFTVLRLMGGNNSIISGTGVWGAMNSIVMDKSDGLLDSVVISATQFASASNSSTNYMFKPISGILKFTNGLTNYLSSDIADTVAFMPGSGLNIVSGTVGTKTSLITNANTTFLINGGNLNVGNQLDEHFLYKTGTSLQIINGNVTVAGTFSRSLPSSLINLNLTNNITFRVNNIGNTDPTRIGFDISNNGSTFNMDGGRVIVVNGAGTSLSEFDIRLNANNGVVSGGAIQLGDSTVTPAGTLMKFGGVMPIYNLHLANTTNNISSKLSEVSFNIKNDLIIDANHTFLLNSNTLNLGGNITNYGIFNGSPGIATTLPWLLNLNGTGDQTIFNNVAPGLNIYNLRLDKLTGKATLAATGNSNIIVRGSLEFANDNNAFIDASATGRYVSLDPDPGSNAQILRVGLGHVFGRLYHWVKAGAQNITFTVGADSIQSYRPLVFESFDNDNTAGLVGVYSYSIDHPDFPSSMANHISNIHKYWNVNVNGFALGAGRSYNAATYWVIPADTIGRGNPNTFLYEHFHRSPGYPAAGTWSSKTTPIKGSNFISSSGNNTYGDFIVAEPEGVTFYSIKNGSWTDPTTWSWTSYYVNDVPSRFPNLETDIVRIGNNKIVNIPVNFNDTVRSIYVEKDPTNNLPGRLNLLGNLGFIRGTTFVLGDDCTIGLQHLNGITSTGQTGAIQTSIRQFGVSRYIYDSYEGSQTTGAALPDSIKSIIIDNPSTLNKTVFLTKAIGSTLKVKDSVLIQQGIMNFANKNLKLYGTLKVDSVVNNGVLNPAPTFTEFAGSGQKYVVINNQTGITLNDIRVNGGDTKAKRTKVNVAQNQHIRFSGIMDFLSPSTFTLDTNVNLKVQSSSPTAITNYANDKYIRTSDTSGLLIRNVIANNSYVYPIGSLNKTFAAYVYTPATYTAGVSGTAGSIGIRTSTGRNIVNIGAHRFLSANPLADYILRYWAVDSVTTTIAGKLSFTYDDSDIFVSETNLTKVGKWTQTFERSPGTWNFPSFTNNFATNTFETNSGLAYTEFRGDWVFGNESAFRRIFYSRLNGLWSNDQSWTYNSSHTGAIFGNGIIPDNDKDSVVIGGSHEIILDNNYTIQGLTVGTNTSNYGTLNLQSNIISGLYFDLKDNSTLKIGHPNGISALPTTDGNIQTTGTRNYNGVGILANFEYNGSSNQVVGSGLPTQIRNFTVNNSGIVSNNIVLTDKNLDISENLNVTAGAFDMSVYSASKLAPSGTFNISANAYLRIGGDKNLQTSINNYSTYNVDIDSYIDFYGSSPNNQTINLLPSGLVSGLGYVNLFNSGTKFVTAPMLIRRNITIFAGAILQNEVGVNALQVLGNVINRSTINNEGIIEIGQ